MSRTIGNLYNREKNSFNDIRFILAFLVLFFHSYELLPNFQGKDPITRILHGQSSLGGIVVYAFFALSGFFMIQSLENSKNLKQYILNRIYRIVPAFWFSLVLFSFVVIPIFSNISIYSSNESAWNFVWKAGTFHIFDYAWTIDGAYPNNLFKDGINGSMWTLKHELALYFFLPILYFICYKNRYMMALALALALALANLYFGFAIFNIPVGKAWILSINEYPQFIYFLVYFMAGVCIYLFREFILSSKRWVIALLILFGISCVYGNLKIILIFFVPYLFILLGVRFKSNIFSKYGDYSYGMYIYAFPIQQLCIQEIDNLTPITLTLYSFILTLILSIISFHFIEKPILDLKRK